jgi:Bacterial archaeo-eukaryotic release factor family 10
VDAQRRLVELAKLPPAARPVVSVYLDTRWTDEAQRERVRIFLKNHLREARAAAEPRPSDDDLDWIEAQGQQLAEGALLPEASGVALFAGGDGLREMLPVRAAFADAFIVNARPHLRPLAAALNEVVPALVVFVDGVHARLLPLTAQGTGEEVALHSEVDGRHAATDRFDRESHDQRHIEEQRGHHYDAVARAVADLAQRHAAQRIVLAGEARAVSLFREHLPRDIDDRVVVVIAAAAHEPMTTIAERAAEHLAHVDERQNAEAVDRLLDAAAKRGRAVTGLEPTLEAVNRNAVQHLYLLADFGRLGAVCQRCTALQPAGESGRCQFCGDSVEPTELGETMTNRVLASGGKVGLINRHVELGSQGGVGAILRYAA